MIQGADWIMSAAIGCVVFSIVATIYHHAICSKPVDRNIIRHSVPALAILFASLLIGVQNMAAIMFIVCSIIYLREKGLWPSR